jgi:hypothetical protein
MKETGCALGDSKKTKTPMGVYFDGNSNQSGGSTKPATVSGMLAVSILEMTAIYKYAEPEALEAQYREDSGIRFSGVIEMRSLVFGNPQRPQKPPLTLGEVLSMFLGGNDV